MKHIFLQGPSGIGKSTILRKVLTPYIQSVSGFTTQRLKKNGAIIGLSTACLDDSFPPLEVEVDVDAQHHPIFDNVFLFRGKWMGHSVLEQTLINVKQRAESPDIRLILLDEIGGIEMISAVFMKTLEQLLHGSIPCFGVFKSCENLDRAISNLNFSTQSAKLHEQHKRLETLICSRGEILTVTEQNREEVCEIVEKQLW
jgi:nucleoside-triphosphatase THEP1